MRACSTSDALATLLLTLFHVLYTSWPPTVMQAHEAIAAMAVVAFQHEVKDEHVLNDLSAVACNRFSFTVLTFIEIYR